MSLHTPQLVEISIDDIDTSGRQRQVNLEFVEGILLPSIQSGGMEQPIKVRPTDGTDKPYKLVFGMHRLTAQTLAGQTTILAILQNMSDDEASLAEIDENLIRNDGDALERADFLATRKAIYERIYPEAKQGGDRKSDQTDKMSVRSFAADAAEKSGLDARSIRRSVSIATKLCPKVKALIRGTDIADKQANLLNLIKHDADDQMFLAKAMLRAENPARNIAAARDEMMGKVAGKPKTQTDKLQNNWARANAKERSEFLNWLVQSKQPIPAGFELRDTLAGEASD